MHLGRAGQQIAFHANATGHSIARPIACGNRVPPQRTVFGETTDPQAGQMLFPGQDGR